MLRVRQALFHLEKHTKHNQQTDQKVGTKINRIKKLCFFLKVVPRH